MSDFSLPSQLQGREIWGQSSIFFTFICTSYFRVSSVYLQIIISSDFTNLQKEILPFLRNQMAAPGFPQHSKLRAFRPDHPSHITALRVAHFLKIIHNSKKRNHKPLFFFLTELQSGNKLDSRKKGDAALGGPENNWLTLEFW